VTGVPTPPRTALNVESLAQKWEAEAEIIESSDTATKGRRGVAAEALRACARDLREAAETTAAPLLDPEASKQLRVLLAEYDEAWSLMPSEDKAIRTIRAIPALGHWVIKHRDVLTRLSESQPTDSEGSPDA
jgi:uncharacterized membrane protein YccC